MCTTCERQFNLGEYRRPSENRGRDFRGYMDADHFDKAMFAAAEQIKTTRGFGLEGGVMGWAWVALGVSFGLKVVLGWNLFDWLPEFIPVHGLWLVTLVVWGAWHTARLKKLLGAVDPEKGHLFEVSLAGAHTDSDTIPSMPKFHKLQNRHLLWSTARAGRTYPISHWRKPTHANRPFMKRLRSGRAVSTSTTRRSSKR